MSTTILTEAIELIEGTLDHTQRTVDVVLIRPGWSQNGKYYDRKVLEQAAPMYENARAFANHPTREALRRGDSRSVTDLTGRFYNVRIGEGGELRATRKVYDNAVGNAVWPVIVDSIESKTPVIGLSINSVGLASNGERDGKKGIIVEAITAVNSVDDVISPAAGGEFSSLMADGNALLNDVLNTMSFEEWRAARPEFESQLKKEWQVVRQTDAVAAANTERDQAVNALVEAQRQNEQLQQDRAALETQLASLREDVSRKAAEVGLERALREAMLPTAWEEQLREQLNSAPIGDWVAIVARERSKAQGMTTAHKASPVAVQGAPQRVAVRTMAPAPRADGPIYLGEDATPETLMQELAKRR